MLAWPSRRWTKRMSTPVSMRSVAAGWRSMCGVLRRARPLAAACRRSLARTDCGRSGRPWRLTKRRRAGGPGRPGSAAGHRGELAAQPRVGDVGNAVAGALAADAQHAAVRRGVLAAKPAQLAD